MFFFSHQTDRLNPFILTDFSCSLSNVEKITSTILPLASNILFPPLPFRLFSNLFSVTMLALLLRISSKIAQKCRYKIVEFILSTLLKKGQDLLSRPFLIGYQNDAKCRSIDLLAAYAVCPTRQCSRFLHKAPWHGSADKNRAHNKCAPAGVFSFYRYSVFLTFKSDTLLLKSPEFLSGKTSVR